jgi:CheY-like chemotaxis protein
MNILIMTQFGNIIIDEKLTKQIIKLKKTDIPSRENFDGHLIVDDIPANRMVLSKMLKILKIECDEAENGLDALDYVSQKNYKMIWMDIKMPILDGIESTTIIRNYFNFDGPIYAITAYTDNITRKNCESAGINKVIAKPISLRLIKQVSDSLN